MDGCFRPDYSYISKYNTGQTRCDEGRWKRDGRGGMERDPIEVQG